MTLTNKSAFYHKFAFLYRPPFHKVYQQAVPALCILYSVLCQRSGLYSEVLVAVFFDCSFRSHFCGRYISDFSFLMADS